jgi:tripartite-type tricarboxylate transporter receptor subunit TctC
LVAPAQVGKDIVTRLHSETVNLLRKPDVKELLASVGAEAVGNTPDAFALFIQSERTKYARVIKEANIRADWISVCFKTLFYLAA